MEKEQEPTVSNPPSSTIPSECIVTQKELTFLLENASSIAAANKNSYLFTRHGVGYQLYEDGTLVVDHKDTKKYSDLIYLESQKSYFIQINGEGIFKQERGNIELQPWFTEELNETCYTSKSLGTNIQENIITYQSEDGITVIPIKFDGSPGTKSIWEWKKTDGSNINIISHRFYGEKENRIALITDSSKQLILLKMTGEENSLQEEVRYTLPSVGDRESKSAQALALCPLKQLLAVSLFDHYGLVVYKLEGEAAVLFTTLAVDSFFDTMTMLGYRGDNLLMSCIPYSYEVSQEVFTYSYNTVDKTLKEIENLRKPAPVSECKKMVSVGYTVLAAGSNNKFLSINYV